MKRFVETAGIVGALFSTMVLVPAAQAQDGAAPPGYYAPAPGHSSYRDRRGYREGYAYPGDHDRHPDRCRGDGAPGAILGAIAGGLLGNTLAGHGDRAAGTVLGGVGGALAGRAIGRGC